MKCRMDAWKLYDEMLSELAEESKIELQTIPKDCIHNAHMFYIKTKNAEERGQLIDFLKANGIWAVFHYIPLHSAPAGKKYGYFAGEDKYTTRESERLLRLPMYYGLTLDEVEYICGKVKEFYLKV